MTLIQIPHVCTLEVSQGKSFRTVLLLLLLFYSLSHLEVLIARNPNSFAAVVNDDLFHFVINSVNVLALND